MRDYVKNILPIYEGNFKDCELKEKEYAEDVKSYLRHLLKEIEKQGTLDDSDIEPLYKYMKHLQKARDARINARTYLIMLTDIDEHQH